MTELRIGVVAEGPTDQIVLRHLLTAYCRNVRPDITPVFKDLQPNPDGTSSGSPEGGWSQVYRWCLNNPPPAREALFIGRDLFGSGLDNQKHDLILVHMDSDICEMIGASSSIRPVPDATSSPERRGTFIRKTLLEWLWPDDTTPDERHVPAPAVEVIEAWLVAALSEDEQPETSKDIPRRLIEVDYRSRGKVAPVAAKGFRKRSLRYEDISTRSAANVARVVATCPHFRSLAETLFPVSAI
jgi:hypothetical protein